MTKFKVKNIHISHNNKLFEEGSVIELEDKEAELLTNYLDPIIESNKQKNSKNKASDNTADGNSASTSESGNNTPNGNTGANQQNDTPEGGNK